MNLLLLNFDQSFSDLSTRHTIHNLGKNSHFYPDKILNSPAKHLQSPLPLQFKKQLVCRDFLIALSRHMPFSSAYELQRLGHEQILFFVEYIKKFSIDKVVISHQPHIGYDYALLKASSILGIPAYFCEWHAFIPGIFKVNLMLSYDICLEYKSVPASFAIDISALAPNIEKFYDSVLSRNYWYLTSKKSTAYQLRQYINNFNYFLVNKLERYRSRYSPHLLQVTDKVAIFFMHFQPEMTTSFLGGNFNDQLLAIESFCVLSKNLKLRPIIKDHPFVSKPPARYKDYYNKLYCLSAKYNAIVLTSMEHLSVSIHERIAMVSTIAGTVGIEYALDGFPVIYYGNPWYSGFPNTFSIDDVDLQSLSDKLNSNAFSKLSFESFFSSIIDLINNGWIEGSLYDVRKEGLSKTRAMHSLESLLSLIA